jgi:hypothetical protein
MRGSGDVNRRCHSVRMVDCARFGVNSFANQQDQEANEVDSPRSDAHFDHKPTTISTTSQSNLDRRHQVNGLYKMRSRAFVRGKEYATAPYLTMSYIEQAKVQVFTTHPWRLGALAS